MIAKLSLLAVTALCIGVAGTACAELAISANDNKVVLVNGAATIVQNPAPDTVSIIDLSAKPPKLVAEKRQDENRAR